MLQFLEALNPRNCCFSVTDFEDALVEINSILKKIDTTPSQSLEETKLRLEKSFSLTIACLNATRKQKTDKEIAFLLSEILRQYATLCYNENHFSSKQILLASLNFHLYSIGIFNDCIDIHDYTSIEDIKRQSERHPNLFYSTEHSILTTSIDRCLTLAYTSSFVQFAPKNKLFCLAEITKWLGYCYQHIDQTLASNDDNDLRFSNLFKLSESLYLLADTEESKLCLANLYCEAWPFMHLRKDPKDLKGAYELYEKALSYDSSKKMQAQVANQRFLLLFSHEKNEEALPYIKKAILCAESLEENDNNLLLLASLYDNYASYLIDPETLDIEHAEINLIKASKYIAQYKAKGKDHLQFALFDIHFSEFKFISGDLNGAKETIQRAITTLHKYPHSQKSHLLHAEALNSLIEKKLTGSSSSHSERLVK